MPLDIIITGASGRMGTTIRQLVEADPALSLYALLERPEKIAEVHSQALIGHDLDSVLAQFKKEKGAEAVMPVIVDFTSPESSLAFASIAAKYKASMVMGTTGLNEEQKKSLAQLAKDARILWSPNMSVGVNTLLKVLPELSKLLGADYDIELVELHHRKKKDSPSGTALLLAESCASAKGWDLNDCACYHREGIIGERPQEQIGVQAVRGGDVVGVHTVYFMGPGERIEVTHQAHSRENFAQGALRAVKWLSTQQAGRLYAFKDLLQ